MPQSLARIHIHLVFSTKNRVAYLGDDTRDPLHRYLATILKDRGCRVTLINSVEDHIHLLFELGRTVSVSSMVEDLKKNSSRWLKTEMGIALSFAWQAGYGAFSVSESHVCSVARYVADQQEHHRKRSFQDEFRALCVEHGVEFDERYVWDWAALTGLSGLVGRLPRALPWACLSRPFGAGLATGASGKRGPMGHVVARRSVSSFGPYTT